MAINPRQISFFKKNPINFLTGVKHEPFTLLITKDKMS